MSLFLSPRVFLNTKYCRNLHFQDITTSFNIYTMMFKSCSPEAPGSLGASVHGFGAHGIFQAVLDSRAFMQKVP